jgi:Uncharacterised protein family (UPF0175)
MMLITVELPEDIALHLNESHPDLSRAALEAIAVEGARSGALTTAQVRRLLGFETRLELGAFLKSPRGILTDYRRGDWTRRWDKPDVSPPMVVVADSSPINYLALIGELELLKSLYGRILMPRAVMNELRHPSAPPLVATFASAPPNWIEAVEIEVRDGIVVIVALRCLALPPGSVHSGTANHNVLVTDTHSRANVFGALQKLPICARIDWPILEGPSLCPETDGR